MFIAVDFYLLNSYLKEVSSDTSLWHLSHIMSFISYMIGLIDGQNKS